MYDLIIIGAGPAGSAAGRLAGKKGLKTLLLEKEVFPRYKPCGGVLSVQAMSYLDFPLPPSLQERKIFGARVHFKGQSVEKHQDYLIGITATRNLLDNYLMEKAQEAGIEVKQGEKVADYEDCGDYLEVYTANGSYKARFVIVAEGAMGKLKNKIRRKDEKDEYAVCMVAEIAAENKAIDKYIYNALDIYFGVVNRGYGWIFPHEKYFSVGLGGLARHFHNPKKTMHDFLKARGFQDDYKLRSHLVPAGGIRRNVVGSRVILCGDAAGFVDSFCGEGMAYAIRSGQIAVEVIADILLQKQPISSLKNYELICEREFWDNLKYSLVLSKMMHRFPGIFFKVFTGSQEVIDKYLEVPALKRTYKSYIQWLVPRIPKYLLLKS